MPPPDPAVPIAGLFVETSVHPASHSCRVRTVASCVRQAWFFAELCVWDERRPASACECLHEAMHRPCPNGLVIVEQSNDGGVLPWSGPCPPFAPGLHAGRKAMVIMAGHNDHVRIPGFTNGVLTQPGRVENLQAGRCLLKHAPRPKSTGHRFHQFACAFAGDVILVKDHGPHCVQRGHI